MMAWPERVSIDGFYLLMYISIRLALRSVTCIGDIFGAGTGARFSNVRRTRVGGGCSAVLMAVFVTQRTIWYNLQPASIKEFNRQPGSTKCDKNSLILRFWVVWMCKAFTHMPKDRCAHLQWQQVWRRGEGENMLSIGLPFCERDQHRWPDKDSRFSLRFTSRTSTHDWN